MTKQEIDTVNKLVRGIRALCQDVEVPLAVAAIDIARVWIEIEREQRRFLALDSFSAIIGGMVSSLPPDMQVAANQYAKDMQNKMKDIVPPVAGSGSSKLTPEEIAALEKEDEPKPEK